MSSAAWKQYQRERVAKWRKANPEKTLTIGRKSEKKRDPEKRRQSVKAWWDTNHSKRRIYEKTRYNKKRKRLIKLQRSSNCADCETSGETTPIEFHHLDPSAKIAPISTIALLRSELDLKRELAKCIPLCAPCHRKRHAKS